MYRRKIEDSKKMPRPIRCVARLAALLLLMICGTANVAWGQDPYEGTWYITNGSNYYLCPAGTSYQNDYDTPYLTTFQTNKDKNSIWRIVKVEDGTDTYYRFIHNATGKYLTANNAVDGVDAAYLRLHLESFVTPTDATLFIIVKHTNNKLAIRSKDYNDAANNHYWLDISSGNKNNYWNGNYQGSLGFWYNNPIDDDRAAPWTLQEATPTCATPIITYNEAGNTFSISYPISSDGATIHYTTDGTEPTVSSATYSGVISGASVTTKLRAIAVATGYTNSEEAMVYGSTYFATPHLFKTIDDANQSYYLISPTDDADDNAGRQYLTTSNVPNARMQWLVKPASCNSGIQYYHLVNHETGKYVYFTGTGMNQGSTFVVKSHDEDGAEADRFMFRIWERSADEISYFNFSPKMISYALPTQNQNNMLTKQNATDHTNPTGVYRDDNTGGRARWHMVDVPADPKSLSALPAEMVSTESNIVYFKLRNAAQTNSEDYFVYPPSATTYATAATTGNNPEWYLFPADDVDTWNTYYYIRNAQTGNYLYFDGTTKYDGNNNKFLTSSDIITGSEDKFKFLVLKTANTTYSGTYHIVPKPMKDSNNQANIALNRNNTTLRISQSRNSANSCWYLDATPFKCAVPAFQYASGKLSITCSTNGAVIYYALGSTAPTISEANRYTGPITLSEGPSTVTALAVRNSDESDKSDAASFTMEIISSGDDITNMNGFYTLSSNFTPSDNPIGTEDNPFRGTIDGQLNAFSISHPLFAYVEDAVIKNVILDNVKISSGISSGDDAGNTGAIACVAKGTTRIYNCGILATNSTVSTDDDGYTKITSCSSTISGSGYVGGIVGLLDDSARVINCFSYANITGGNMVGGIVGKNKMVTTSANLNTMVMNCMFYGEVSGTSIAPIYNGEIITNAGATGVGNYNYFRLEAKYVQPTGVNYHCALGAEDRFLQRFEFYRNLLNSHRELAGWWATGTYSSSEMMKWVLEPSQIGSSTPYPILKAPGKYPSVVNIDADNATAQTDRNKGGLLGTLSVTIQMGNGAQYEAPTGAEITTTSLTLNITDKDPEHFNFNYAKVQLPYYNDVGTKNYTGNRVVTGWKIVSITGGTPGSFTTGADYPAYNFADRNCTNKDLYGTGGSNRIFNQGAYWDVPEGVTAITIEPYWAKCVYLADQNADKVYNTNMTEGYDVPNVGGGQIYTNGNSYSIAGENQVVYTTISNAIASSGTALFAGVTATSHTVYDYAVVLVGNYHNYNSIEAGNGKPYTVTSIDLDGDNEPDYSYILRFDSRKALHPVRVDFINIPGLGMAQKSTGGTGSFNFGIFQPKYWFESTNTSLFRVTQFEYDKSDRVAAPYIVQGGVIEQWVSGQSAGVGNKTTYFQVGGNVWFREFHRGTHQDATHQSNHPPVSVTGGDYNEFYLTGLYTADVTSYPDNAECYINGGHFGTVCGAAMEGIGKANGADNTGNITWQIQNADIHEFYAGGLNADKPVTGNLNTTIVGSHVDLFCGGPKFGDMSTGKTVVTNATSCIFGTFFGAGYGGNSYSRQAPRNHSGIVNFPHTDNQGAGYHSSWNNWLEAFYTQAYNSTYGGISTQFSYQFLPMSGNANNVARIFVDYVKFSLATCHNVTSELTGCTVTGNFYGGGSLGKVGGPVTSTLDSCTVNGNVYGAGFSASLPTVEVDSIGFRIEPYYYTALGTYRTGVKGQTTTYAWEEGASIGVNNENHVLTTTEDLDALGSINGDVTLTIKGKSLIGTYGDTTGETGNVFGGGESSPVTGAGNKITVNLQGDTEVYGNVFGGGDEGLVECSTEVNIE